MLDLIPRETLLAIVAQVLYIATSALLVCADESSFLISETAVASARCLKSSTLLFFPFYMSRSSLRLKMN